MAYDVLGDGKEALEAVNSLTMAMGRIESCVVCGLRLGREWRNLARQCGAGWDIARHMV